MSQRVKHRSQAPLLLGLVASAVVHLIMLMLPLAPVGPSVRGSVQRPGSELAATLRVIAISSPAQVLPQRAPALETSSAVESIPEAAAAERESTAASPELGPRQPGGSGALRLPSAVRINTAPTAVERATARIVTELRPFNDSLRDVGSRGKPTDWSTRDGKGRRWGASPGEIHVAGRSFSPCKLLLDPVTCQFRISDAERRESWERQDLHREIQLQAAKIEIGQQLKGRVKAMEARKAAARDTMPGHDS